MTIAQDIHIAEYLQHVHFQVKKLKVYVAWVGRNNSHVRSIALCLFDGICAI